MTKLKLSNVLDDKPVKLSIKISTAVYRNLDDYAEILSGQTGQAIDPGDLVAPMLTRFMATDRDFVRALRAKQRRSTSLVPTHAARKGHADGP
jgi:hypothetical protein